jgi:hypothetical protein
LQYAAQVSANFRRLARLLAVPLIVLTSSGLVGAQQAVDKMDAGIFPQQVKLTASDGAKYDVFGDGIAIRGNVAMVGAPAGSGAFPGAVYVYERQAGLWLETQKLEPSDGIDGDRFGQAIAIHGDLAIVGAIHVLNTGPGAAYVYRYDGSAWSEEQKLLAADAAPADRFGTTVSITPEMAIIGASFHDHMGGNSGSVFVFEIDQGTWIETQEVMAPDGAPDDHFGNSICRKNDVLLIGASGDDNHTGAAYYFEFDGSQWQFKQKLTAPDGVVGDGFGVNVTMAEGMALIGASQVLSGGTGVAYVFLKDGAQWQFGQKLVSSDAAYGDKFGLMISMQKKIAVIGAPMKDGLGTDSGAAYLFEFNGSSWVETRQLLATDGSASQYFGSTVAVSRNRAIIGAPLGDGNEVWTGAAYLFTRL